jgi:uncharacterized repeat protein (TIGR01451 family)
MNWNPLKKCWLFPILKAHRPRRRKSLPARPRVRLRLEELEDRTVPTVLDLTGSLSQEGFINGALFRGGLTQPAGGGNIDSFLQVEQAGQTPTEQGYNTDFRPVGKNATDPVLTDIASSNPVSCQSVAVNAPPIVTIGGVAYREFVLDINQTGGSPLISLDSLQIFLGTAPNLTSTGFNSSGQLTGLGTLVYNMGANNTVLLKDFGTGHGTAEYFADIPVSDFTGTNPYIYLYCHFGGQGGAFVANDGFEEWAIQSNTGLLLSQTGTNIHLGATDNGPPVSVAGGTLPLGSTVHDSAIVTSPAGNPRPTGTVTFTFYTNGTGTPPGTSAGTVTLVNGVADPSAAESNLMAGSYSFTAHYSGDSNYAPSDSGVETLTISKGTSFGETTILDAATNLAPTGTPGESVFDTATGGVRPPAFTPTGTVTYTFTGTNGTSLAGLTAPSSWTVSADRLTWTETVTVNATATSPVPNSDVTGPLPTGTYAFTASYSGDRNYNGVTGAVEPLAIGSGVSNTQTAILDATTRQAFTGPLGESVIDSATVTGNPTTPTSGTVTYTFAGTNGTSLANATPGSPSWTVSADKLTWTEEVTLNTEGTVPNSDPTGPLPAGSYQFQATYSGVTGIAGSTSAVEPMTINKGISFGQTTILDEVTKLPPTGALGESVFDTATGDVSPAAFTPTGTVTYTFKGILATSLAGVTAPPSWTVSPNGLTWMETVTVNATATPPVPNSDVTGVLPGGNYVFQATYSGDSNYQGLTSDFEPFNIGPGTSITQTTILDAGTNLPPTGAPGESVFDTAKVTGSPAVFTPTGAVTYIFTGTNGTSLAGVTAPSSWTVSPDQLTWTETVPLNADGTVPNSDVTGALPTGTYAFTALYNSGGANYAASISTVEPLDISPIADVVLVKTANPMSVVMGTVVTYTYVVHNNGPDTAVNVVVTDPFPPGLTFVSAATPSQGTFDPATSTWHVGDLANGATATLQVTAIVNGTASIINTATASTVTFDPDLSNNTDSAIIVPVPPSKRAFLASADPPANANQAWLSKVYQDLLHRPIDPVGMAEWSGLLNQGVSPIQIVQDIEASPEYRINQVEALYGQFLHRAADPAGLGGFVSFLQGGGTVEQVAAMIAGSPEFFQVSGGTNSGFLAALYQDALGRSLDPVGAAEWGALLSQGVSRNQVALDILSSPEYDQHLVAGFYTMFLNRAADPSSISWVNALLQGMRDETAIAGITASPEFFNLA